MTREAASTSTASHTKTGGLADSDPKPNKQPWYQGRIWNGANLTAWYRAVVLNRFDVSWRRLDLALSGLLYGFINSGLGALQRLIYGRKIDRTQFSDDPIFILGHWRTGTTLLHELLILDDRHTCPSTYACVAANHFLLTGWWFPYIGKFLLPKQRPMDNMPLGWDAPQEDEFALCALGVPTPYFTVACPNRPPMDEEYFDLERIPPAALADWKRSLKRFLQAIAYRDPRRLVVKSPLHTARIKVLLEMFPRAKFAYITRDPYVVYPSTVHLWKSLYTTNAFQIPTYEGVEERVFQNFVHMHDQYQATKALIPAGRLYELRYEDLVREPVQQMRQLYESLGLGRFEQALPAIEGYLSKTKDYQTNRYRITPELRGRITQQWQRVIEQQGYEVDPPDQLVMSRRAISERD
jgi:hypothetical protein